MTAPARVRSALFVLKGGPAGPSRFVRGLIYRDLFAADGVLATYFNLDDQRIGRLLEGSARLAGGAPLRRALVWSNRLLREINKRRLLSMAPDYDAIYLLKCGSMELFSRLRRVTAARIVYDLNDAQWLAPRAEHAEAIGLEQLLRSVDGVTCDNEYTASFARQFNERTHVVPDPCQVELFEPWRGRVEKPSDGVVLGWLGSPDTARNLYVIWEVLEELFRRHRKLRLRLVGVGEDRRLWPPFESVRYSVLPTYSTNEMIREVLGMHIGLFPLFDVEDSRARGVLKATVYMSGEAVAVCSRVGQCNDMIVDGENGMLASSREEWLEKIETLISNPEGRRAIARRGLESVRERSSVRATFARLQSALRGDDPATNGPARAHL